MDLPEKSPEEVMAELEENEQVTFNDDGSRTVDLEEAVEFKKEMIERVVFRRPTGADWLATDKEKGEFGKSLALAASCSGVAFTVFKRMTGDDALLCVQVVTSMGKKFRRLGEKS